MLGIQGIGSIPIIRMGNGALSAPARSFADTLVDVYGADEVWLLSDIVSGTTIQAYVNPARNGVLSGWSLQSTPSSIFGYGGLAPSIDAVNDYGNLHTANLSSMFNGGIGGFCFAAKVRASSVWTDGAIRTLLLFYADASNYLYVSKVSNNTIRFEYRCGGGIYGVNHNISTTDWFVPFMTWRDMPNGGEFNVYVNGVQSGSSVPVGTTWSASSLDSSLTTIFCFGQPVTAEVWDGYGEVASLWAGTAPSAADILAMYTDQVS